MSDDGVSDAVRDQVRDQVRELFHQTIGGGDIDEYTDAAIKIVIDSVTTKISERLETDGWHGPEVCADLCLEQHGPYEPLRNALARWHGEHHAGPIWLCRILPCLDARDHL